jgi:hypothetical protein
MSWPSGDPPVPPDEPIQLIAEFVEADWAIVALVTPVFVGVG